MARRTLTDRGVEALKPRATQYKHADPQMPGHYVRVLPSGAKSFAVVTRDPNGKQVWQTIGSSKTMTVAESREQARAIAARIRTGKDRAGPQTFQTVAETWFRRQVEGRELISSTEIRRYLDRILKAWGGRDIASIGRGDVAKLLDDAEDRAGPSAADFTLSILSRVFMWHVSRTDQFVSPIVRGMRRTSPKARARSRILSDDEIRKLWDACAPGDGFGDLCKLLLLTGQRREKVASMRWQDIAVDGLWSMPMAEREKSVGGDLKLPELALDIIRARPRFAGNPYVFAGRGGSYSTGYSKAKTRLDKELGFPQWGLHDLRRTARSMMSRAGVRPDIAERVLGHAIGGVAGIYDRHEYLDEKAHALQALASLVQSVVNPSDKIVHIRQSA